jgi:hypothetical protein
MKMTMKPLANRHLHLPQRLANNQAKLPPTSQPFNHKNGNVRFVVTPIKTHTPAASFVITRDREICVFIHQK